MPSAKSPLIPEELLIPRGKLNIFARHWRPANAPRAIIVINHGVNAHGGQYQWAAEQFAGRDFSVYAIDMRGRGKSEGPRFTVDNISEYTGDLHALITLAKSREPGLPVFLLGHSAGGVVACSYALDNQAEIKGLICESFAYQVPAPGFALAIIKALSGLFPNLPVLKLKNEAFSRDPAVVRALNDDPLTQNETQPARTVAALSRANERLKREFPKITLPVLILHGSADKVTVPAGSQYFHKHSGSKDKTLKLYTGHVHDLLSDFGKEEVMADIVAWIDRRLI